MDIVTYTLHSTTVHVVYWQTDTTHLVEVALSVTAHQRLFGVSTHPFMEEYLDSWKTAVGGPLSHAEKDKVK
jgi:uncharacterized protein Usg